MRESRELVVRGGSCEESFYEERRATPYYEVATLSIFTYEERRVTPYYLIIRGRTPLFIS